MAINWTGTFPLSTFQNPVTVTLSEQICAPPPGDGAYPDWYNDGEGMHTLIPHDLARSLNNLGSYCQPWAQYVQQAIPGIGGSTDKNGETSITPAAGNGEYLIFQFPIVVPPGALKMFFTAGVTKSSGAGTGTITAVTVYLSQIPYTNTAGNGAALFDRNGLVTQSNNAVGMSQAQAIVNSNSYTLISDTVTNCGDAAYQDAAANGSAAISNLIFTMSCDSPSSLVMGVKDFTCWFAWE